MPPPLIPKIKESYPQLFTDEKYALKEILSHQDRKSMKIEYIKQTELTTRIVVYLLRSIGDMLSEVGESQAVFWLQAARIVDPQAVVSYTALSNYYKRKILVHKEAVVPKKNDSDDEVQSKKKAQKIESLGSDVALDFVYGGFR